PCVQAILGLFIYRFQPVDVDDYIWEMRGTHPTTGKTHREQGSFSYGGWVDSLLKQEHLDILAKEASLDPLSKEATTLEIKTKTDIITASQVLYVASGFIVESSSVVEFYLGQTGTMVAMVKFGGVPFSGATVTGDYYKPDDSVFLSDQSFTEVGSTGVYSHTFNVPSNAAEGVYKVKMKAVKSVGGSSFSDNFNDGNADGWVTSGATWVVVDEGAPQNFVYKKTDYGAFIYAFKADEADLLNGTYKAKVRCDSPGGNYVGIAFRFYFRRGAGNVRLMKHTSGTAITLEETNYYSLTVNFDQFYELKVVLLNGSIKCYVDDALQIDYNDADPKPAGKIGLFSYNSIASYDDADVVVSGLTEEAYVARDFRISKAPGVIEFIAE
ncbi:hypothetical protein LCGC14_2648610, partial [marine sediment metagenome]